VAAPRVTDSAIACEEAGKENVLETRMSVIPRRTVLSIRIHAHILAKSSPLSPSRSRLKRPFTPLQLIANTPIFCTRCQQQKIGCQNAGYSVTTARMAEEGLQLFAVSPVNLVLLDYAMPDMNGDDVAATMKRIKPDVRILMFSGVSNLPENARLHVDAFLQKGQSPTVVLNKIEQLLRSSGEAA
jgi:CheY-like chemotaxis protein